MDPLHTPFSETPTSALLPPIRERKVSARRRRRPTQPVSAFPPIPVRSEYTSVETHSSTVSDSTPLRKASTADGLQLPSEVHLNNGTNSERSAPSDAARAAFLAIPEHDIQATQTEILRLLDSTSIEFLKEKWQRRGLGNCSNELFHAPEMDTNKVRGSSLEHKGYSPSLPFVSESNTLGSSTDASDAAPPSKNNLNDLARPSTSAALSSSMSVDRFETHFSDIRNSLLIPDGPVDEKEGEKLMWTTDAEIPVASEVEIDSVLRKIVLSLGSIANARFDFDGQMLSSEEMRSLPTHLGLHHHGSSPASAGYALPDVLTLMRSTLVSQRVLALRILSAILRVHGAVVFEPLLESGALDLAFAPFPSPEPFFTSIMSQVAYLDLVDVLIRPFRHVSCHELVPDLFFASRFYSPFKICNPPTSIFNVLAGTDCVLILIRIAFANYDSNLTKPVTLIALQLVRDIVISNDDACLRILSDAYCSNALRHLSVIPGECLSEGLANVPALSSDVIAQSLVRLWDRDDILAEVKKHFVTDSFLRNVSNHLFILLRDDLPLSKTQVLCAAGSLRVMRAALTFGIGLLSVSVVIQPLTRLLHENGSTVVEAYLLLEAYVHCLLEHLTFGGKSKDSEQLANEAQKLGIDYLSDSFVMDQMSGLVPVALSSVKRFASPKKDDNHAVKAAAGHFSATFLAIYRIPFDPYLLALVLGAISRSTSELSSTKLQDVNDFVLFQHMASVGHAGARLLTRVELDPLYVRRELSLLLKAAEIERQLSWKFKEQAMWRPVVNACVEWLGLLARVENGRRCVELGINVIPWVTDVQVLIDLLTRLLLRAETLCSLSSSISLEAAQRSVRVLLSATITELKNGKQFISSAEEDIIDGVENEEKITTPGGFSIFDVMTFWTQSKECLDPFVLVLSAFFDNDLLRASDLFGFLLPLSPKFLDEVDLSERIFILLLRSGSLSCRNGQRLILHKDETMLSTISTTPNPELAVVILTLGAHLVSRGPVDLNVNNEECDALSSIILSFILRADVDVSLRATLWKDTIDTCGSSILFTHARLIENCHKNFAEDEQMLRLYVSAIQNRFLLKTGFSPVLNGVVVERLSDCVLKVPDGEISHSLRLALHHTRSSSEAEDVFALLLQYLDVESKKKLQKWWSQF